MVVSYGKKQLQKESMGLCEQLGQFENSIKTLQTAVEEIGTSDSSLNATQIWQRSTQLSTQFQQMLEANSSETDSDRSNSPTAESTVSSAAELAIEREIQSYQTEAHRRLRLIGIEAMKLRTARQPITISRGRSQLISHLHQLSQFVQAMRVAVCGS